MPETSSGGNADATLSIDDQPTEIKAPVESRDKLTGRFQAVINTHGCNLSQIQVAIERNSHATDPHPAVPGEYVTRHPILLACFDPSQTDDQGNPLPGAPAELDIDTIRRLYSTRYKHVSADAPPADGSHIDVQGMHTIAEIDSTGQPTGRVRLGNASEVV